MKKVEISVVVPVYNEVENLEELHRRLTEELRKLNRSYEIIIVDDGSDDGSYELLRKLAEKDRHLKVIRFRRNFGQTPALSAGFDFAKGEIIITMDGDLQNDPADIGLLIEKLREGYDLVAGWRADRKDKLLLRKIPSWLANRLIKKSTGIKLHDFGCTLRAYKSDLVRDIKLYGEMHRFIPALAALAGARIAEIKVRHHPRLHGRSKYGISRTIRVLLDLITVNFLLRYATRPIQVFGLVGLISGTIGFLICAYLSIGKLFLPDPYKISLLEHMPLLMLGILLILVGVQFISMGLLGELIVRTYFESQNKPIYYVREVIGEEEKR
ncbi:TPA: glycosyltransferase [Candidatus Poribacteria bacterium]|nr:glycosyltransferase [Candidatus Poribacteria bacterium]HEX30662.1 glycosyltransferase [Candidatus Poribacteria bacterium]